MYYIRRLIREMSNSNTFNSNTLNKNQTANKAQQKNIDTNSLDNINPPSNQIQLNNTINNHKNSAENNKAENNKAENNKAENNKKNNDLLREFELDNLDNVEKNNLQNVLKTANNNNLNNFNKDLNKDFNRNINKNVNKNVNKNIDKNVNRNVNNLDFSDNNFNLAENIEKNNRNTNKNNTNKNTMDKAKKAVSGMFSSAANTVGEYAETVSDNETIMIILKVILSVILFIVFINIIKYFYIRWETNQTSNPMLVNGTKNAKQAMVISQDPQHTNYVPIKRSVDQNGIEFSYALWFLISDFSYKQGEWKHIFHKGNSSSYPNRAPGIWIHPNANIIRIYMNTMKNILEYVDIDNIPIRKWVHIVVVMKNRYLHIYINGFLKVRKELLSLPRQNYGNVWVNMYGGYEGYLSKLQYFDKAIKGLDIDNLVTQGPGAGNCIDTKEVPPYLNDTWWIN